MGRHGRDGVGHDLGRPNLDGRRAAHGVPDPWRVVDRVGKDRPVAVVGRSDDGRLVALMLSSKEHDGDRGWLSIGTGPWDREGRESWVRSDRVLAVPANAVRREGAIMPRDTYARIVASMGGKAAHAAPSVPVKSGGLFATLRRMFAGR